MLEYRQYYWSAMCCYTGADYMLGGVYLPFLTCILVSNPDPAVGACHCMELAKEKMSGS